MGRKITVRNPDHPQNMMVAEGHKAKCHVRKLSNDDLDQFILDRMPEGKERDYVMSLPRGKKIKTIQRSAMKSFSDWFKAEAKKKQELSEAVQ